MLEERYHKTWPLPAACRIRHQWRDKDACDPRHYVANYCRIYRYEECSRCGARQVLRVLFGGYSPYDHDWVQYRERPDPPMTDAPRSVIPTPTPRLNRVPPTV